MFPLWLLPLAPALAALPAGLLALSRRLHPLQKLAPLFTMAAVLMSGLTAWIHWAGPAGSGSVIEGEWLFIPPHFRLTLGVHLDALAILMVVVVCIVSLLVQVYSLGYMAQEKGFARYYAFLSLFTASMLGLVVAGNLFQLYVCWELVGLCSYLLIGFWWWKPSAASAAKKAFVVTRFGDVGFMLGLLLLASAAGSFDYADVTRTVANIASGAQTTVPFVSVETFLWLAPLLLFCGAIGKSAQFPLHIWLPDAMEGPTPVSALIHAATMVAAGVYMVARLFPLFRESGIAMDTVLLIGTITAFLAATIALVQTDIKKVMAYSTVSQLGYMMLGLGAGGRTAGLFHLTTHAAFKALLFLCAGSVIHALHHSEEPNNLLRMGGLRKRMPLTCYACLLGVLALAGFPLLSGFWSKDALLGAAMETENPIAKFAGVVGIVVAAITAFYSLRMWLLAFWGQPRSEDVGHAHEAPLSMVIPLWLLVLPTLFLGFYLFQDHHLAHFLSDTWAEEVNWTLMSVTTVAALLGMGLAWRLYTRPVPEGVYVDPIVRMPGYRLFAGLWGLETFWSVVGAGGALALGRMIAWVDRHIVDKAVNGIGAACSWSGEKLRYSSSGQLQSYAAVILAGILLVLGLLLWYEFHAGPPQAVI